MRPDALGTGDLTTVGIVTTLVLVVVGGLLALLITKLVARVIIAVVVIALAVLVWQQRSHVVDQSPTNKCLRSATFFGVHVDPPANLRCQHTYSGL